MKTIPILVGLFLSTTVFAQTKNIFGKFTKSDGTQLKGTSTTIGYENQLAIISYTGGSDNTATIEIEIPMGTAVGELRNIMNAAIAVPTQVATSTKPIAQPVTINPNIVVQKMQVIKAELPKPSTTITKAEITVGSVRADQKSLRIANKIILEDIKIESCTDDAANGKSKIKLKGTRIGWMYYNYDATGRESSPPTKSGWNVATGQAWNNF